MLEKTKVGRHKGLKNILKPKYAKSYFHALSDENLRGYKRHYSEKLLF